MNNNQSAPDSISHKKLKSILSNARKELSSTDTSENQNIKNNKEFNDLITNWTETSQRILLILNKKEHVSTKSRNPKSLMALGAMGAHINMALQALKAIESDK